MMQRAVQYVESLKGKLEALERDQRKGAPYQIIHETHQTAGKPDKVIRKIVKKSLTKEPDVIV